MRDEGRAGRLWFAVVVALTALFVVLPFTIGGGADVLRDRHSDPALRATIAAVAVAPFGKLYHDPRCTFIHGPAILEPTSSAVAQGFSPCPRCLGTLRAASRSSGL